MEKAGPVIGLPFSIETYAFLFEAIFLSLYLFARDRLSPWLHLATLLPVCLGALASAWIGGPLLLIALGTLYTTILRPRPWKRGSGDS
jgi:bd-type cytochrome oxidase subunit I